MVPRVQSCKEAFGGRLCSRIDVSLIDHGITRLVDLAEAQDANEIGYRAASEYVRAADVAIEESYDAWRDLLVQAHRRIFARGIPAVAGRIRTEPISVGGLGLHRFDGSTPARIEVELERVWARLVRHSPRSVGRFGVALWSADFLERFFRIHPFADGNGRVGRVYLERVASAVGLSYDWANPPDGERRGKRKYLYALQYAHQHVSDSEHRDRDPRKPALVPLACWLERRLGVQAVDEEPPSSGGSALSPVDGGGVSEPGLDQGAEVTAPPRRG